MAITMHPTTEGGTYFCTSDNLRFPITFTPETDPDRIGKFFKFLQEVENVAVPLLEEYTERREWNHTHKGQGKDWPVFRKLERLLSSLQKNAGIINT